MNLIRGAIVKSIISSLLIFVFISVLSFCSIDTLAFSAGSEHSQKKLAAGTYSHPHRDSHPESTAHPHDDREDSSCCFNIQEIITTPPKILLLTQLKNSSLLLRHFLFAVDRNVSQLFLIWSSISDSGPPGSFLSEFAFLVSSPAHAPPVSYQT